MILNPLPSYCIFLLPLFLGCFLLAFRLSGNVTANSQHRNIFSLPLFIVIWFLFVVFSSLVTSSFIDGLIIGTSVNCFLGLLYEFFIRSKNFPILPRPEKPLNKWAWVSALISALVVFYIASNGNFHDEFIVNGHKTTIAQLQNNFFPPRNIINPEDALRYHFGYDVICAGITAVTRCGVDFAMDFLTAFSWFYCWILLWMIGEKLFNSKFAGICTAFCTLFGGGLTYVIGLFFFEKSWNARLMGNVDITDIQINPPLFSYFFQHPFSIGLLITCCILFLMLDNKFPFSKSVYGIISILFIALYFCQTVLFVTLFAVFAMYFIINKKHYLFIPYMVLVMLVLFISKSGLLFTKLHHHHGMDVVLRFWPLSVSILNISGWYIGTFGFLIVFGIYGFFRLNKYHLFFFFIIMLCAFMPMFVVYKFAWDIVKFATTGTFYLGILAGGAVSYLIESKTLLIRRIGLIGIPALVTGPLIYLAFMIYFQNVSWENYWKNHSMQLDEDYIEALNWGRINAGSESSFYVNPEYALYFAVFSGIPTVYDEVYNLAAPFGIPEDRVKRFSEIFNGKTIRPEDFDKYKIGWFLSDPRDTIDYSLLLKTGLFEKKNVFGKLILYKYNPGYPAR